MKTEHTPGPWLIPGSPDLVGTEGPERRLIASVHGPNIEANARLIAAAPDLLATLERLLSVANEGAVMRHETGKPTWSFIDEVKTSARAAIAKATQEP